MVLFYDSFSWELECGADLDALYTLLMLFCAIFFCAQCTLSWWWALGSVQCTCWSVWWAAYSVHNAHGGQYLVGKCTHVCILYVQAELEGSVNIVVNIQCAHSLQDIVCTWWYVWLAEAASGLASPCCAVIKVISSQQNLLTTVKLPLVSIVGIIIVAFEDLSRAPCV